VLSPAHFIYSTAMNLEFTNHKCETDFVVLSHGRGRQIDVAIGECKDEGGFATAQDVANLRAAWQQFRKSRIACYLVFAKTADSFAPHELPLFKSLHQDRIPVILLTNRELEPYHPYWDAATDIPNKYALSLRDMATNSAARYLSLTTAS